MLGVTIETRRDVGHGHALVIEIDGKDLVLATDQGLEKGIGHMTGLENVLDLGIGVGVLVQMNVHANVVMTSVTTNAATENVKMMLQKYLKKVRTMLSCDISRSVTSSVVLAPTILAPGAAVPAALQPAPIAPPPELFGEVEIDNGEVDMMLQMGLPASFATTQVCRL